MNEAVNACAQLFNIKMFLAQGIVSFLRIEDIKIALAKSVHELMRLSGKKEGELDQKLKTQIWQMNEWYTILTSYINSTNVEVALTMELFSNKQNCGTAECAYLYPIMQDTQNRTIGNLQKTKELFYKGNMLPKKMRFGTYLYYRGVISYYMLQESLAWQKNQRPLLGQIAMQIGTLSVQDFAQILVYVKNGYSFGEIARKNHQMSGATIQKIVKSQEKYNCKIGHYFTVQKILSDTEVARYLAEMNLHNKKFSL